MTLTDLWNWMNEKFNDLETAGDWQWEWIKNELKIEESKCDDIDIKTIILFNSAIKNKDQLIVELPDKNEVRGRLLFASILTLLWIQNKSDSDGKNTILYFESSFGIKTALSRTQIRFSRKIVIKYSEFFPQVYVSNTQDKNEIEISNSPTSDLPKTICSYSPSDPIELIRKHSPSIIVINCEDEGELSWLNPIMDFAKSNHIPVVGWTHNPFLRNLDYLNNNGFSIFSWPYNSKLNLLYVNKSYEIEPILIESKMTNLQTNTYISLSKASELIEGRVAKDTLQIGWRLLKTMESLSVPFNLYESEVSHYWGLKSATKLKETYSYFLENLDKASKAYPFLLDADKYMDELITFLKENEPPTWQAILEIIDSKKENGETLRVIFSSKAKQTLFALALLSKKNINIYELENRNIYITNLAEYVKMYDNIVSIEERPIFIGFPNFYVSHKLDKVILNPVSSFLIYNYQKKAFKQKVEEWNNKLNPDQLKNIEIICRYKNIPIPSFDEELNHLNKINLGTSRIIETIAAKYKENSPPIKILEKYDTFTEISNLMQNDYLQGDDSYDDATESTGINGPNADYSANEELYVDNAFDITFENGWKCMFSIDDTVKVINYKTNNVTEDERYVRALKEGDSVLFINGENKRNLLELIYIRLHKVPEIETLIKLVVRWHDDFYEALTSKASTREYINNPLQALLQKIQDHGSKITSTQTLYSWITGVTIAPEDSEDIRRVATVLDMKFEKNYYKQINRAAERIRNIHIKLSRSLYKWLNTQALGIIQNDKYLHESIDEHLDLTLQDFKDSILVLKVRSIKCLKGPFYKEMLGNLERDDMQ